MTLHISKHLYVPVKDLLDLFISSAKCELVRLQSSRVLALR